MPKRATVKYVAREEMARVVNSETRIRVSEARVPLEDTCCDGYANALVASVHCTTVLATATAANEFGGSQWQTCNTIHRGTVTL